MKGLIAYGIGLWLPVAAVLAATSATTFTGTTVENVDTAKQTITIKTKEGQSWTLRVADPQLLSKHNVRKGDQLSLEIDTNNDIIQIAKAGETVPNKGMPQE
jgi:hypothetical protein